MPLIPCSACQRRPQDKLAQVTWAWNRADGRRVAWRQRLCIDCFAAILLPMDTEQPETGPLQCPACHTSVEEDLDPVYATAFVPGTGKIRFEIPSCAPCAVDIRNRAQRHAVQLEDREPVSLGQAQGTPPPADAWAALGIQPRE